MQQSQGPTSPRCSTCEHAWNIIYESSAFPRYKARRTAVKSRGSFCAGSTNTQRPATTGNLQQYGFVLCAGCKSEVNGVQPPAGVHTDAVFCSCMPSVICIRYSATKPGVLLHAVLELDQYKIGAAGAPVMYHWPWYGGAMPLIAMRQYRWMSPVRRTGRACWTLAYSSSRSLPFCNNLALMKKT
jgi:hypothetical protein